MIYRQNIWLTFKFSSIIETYCFVNKFIYLDLHLKLIHTLYRLAQCVIYLLTPWLLLKVNSKANYSGMFCIQKCLEFSLFKTTKKVLKIQLCYPFSSGSWFIFTFSNLPPLITYMWRIKSAYLRRIRPHVLAIVTIVFFLTKSILAPTTDFSPKGSMC